MFDSEEKLIKEIISPNREDEFQIRCFPDENAGILTSRAEKSYFILDSQEYWYDLIQEQYPNKQKCTCKNDFFKVVFAYTPRKGTDDFQTVELISQCTECKKVKTFGQIDINYSPSQQLFEQPITFCEQPKLKYKTYSISGYWAKEALLELTEFLAANQPFIYLWYWNQTGQKRSFHQVNIAELTSLLSSEDTRYLAIYFSSEPLETIENNSVRDKKGAYVDRNIWRKKEIILINAPIKIGFPDSRDLYYMEFCSEFLTSNGEIIPKSEPFCKFTKELLKYSKKNLK